MEWTVYDKRFKDPTAVATIVDSNAEALWQVANGHSDLVYAVNKSDNSSIRYESGIFGDSDRVWDLYNADGRVMTYISNSQAFMVLCRNALDDDVNNDDIWLVNVNDLSERLRWNAEKDWFEIYSA